ncbi:MAG: hypothetical protein NTW16_06045 [Bacteroidetes bacterium]|nr:hypothetical protein [Bacteroidota bacterium]
MDLTCTGQKQTKSHQPSAVIPEKSWEHPMIAANDEKLQVVVDNEEK